MLNFELIFAQHFDREKGLDYGRLLLKQLDFVTPANSGELAIWLATSSTVGLQKAEDFHVKGGIIPPAYRCPSLGSWSVKVQPISMPTIKGVEGNFYQICPFAVTTDRRGHRGDFGILRDANVPGSMGCIVLKEIEFNDFERRMLDLRQQGIKEIPLTVIYS